ncbi:winged helix-turn-helix transcriptional regulator [Streptomyces sp. NPDC054766]
MRDVLDRIGDTWPVLVIVELAGGPRRFRELQRAIDGISQRMLTLTVRRLERDGLVLRTVYPSQGTGPQLVPKNDQGPVSDTSETGPDLRLSPVGTTGFEPATP